MVCSTFPYNVYYDALGYRGDRTLVTAKGQKRILEFTTAYLQPGDILLYVAAQQEETVYVYLGGDAFATVEGEHIAVVREDVLWPAFTRELFFCLRPSLGE